MEGCPGQAESNSAMVRFTRVCPSRYGLGMTFHQVAELNVDCTTGEKGVPCASTSLLYRALGKSRKNGCASKISSCEVSAGATTVTGGSSLQLS